MNTKHCIVTKLHQLNLLSIKIIMEMNTSIHLFLILIIFEFFKIDTILYL